MLIKSRKNNAIIFNFIILFAYSSSDFQLYSVQIVFYLLAPSFLPEALSLINLFNKSNQNGAPKHIENAVIKNPKSFRGFTAFTITYFIFRLNQWFWYTSSITSL
jgi:hypothetical protein